MSDGAGDTSGPATGVKLDETPVNASPRKATVGELVTELKRRRVFRVMVGYGIFAFAVLQVTEPIMHGSGLPDWVLKAVLVALAAGFRRCSSPWGSSGRSLGLLGTCGSSLASEGRERRPAQSRPLSRCCLSPT